MAPIVLQETVLGHPITVSAIPCGPDWQVLVLGGCAPHVGSVTVAAPGRAPETILLPGHRDDVVGERFARRLAQAAGRPVCVTCGIHFEGPSREELAAVVACCDGLLDRLAAQIP